MVVKYKNANVVPKNLFKEFFIHNLGANVKKKIFAIIKTESAPVLYFLIYYAFNNAFVHIKRIRRIEFSTNLILYFKHIIYIIFFELLTKSKIDDEHKYKHYCFIQEENTI